MSVVESTTPEEWRSVVDFPGYEVSDRGRVRSIGLTSWILQRKTGIPYAVTSPAKILKPGTHFNNGKPMCQTVYLRRDGKTYTKRVHRLVLHAFVGPAPEGTEGCHDDGNCLNNALSNLRWDTHQSNIEDSIRHQTHRLSHAKGEAHYRSSLSEDDIRAIRAVPGYRGVCADLGRKYGVSRGGISNIRRLRQWKHVR